MKANKAAQSPESNFESPTEIMEDSRVGRTMKMPSKKEERKMGGVGIHEATIPDAFRGAPKFISPRVHRWLDVGVTAYFAGVGIWFAVRGKAGPAVAAFINAGMVAGVSMYTDYEGTGEKPISFKLHGSLDAAQATTAALAPAIHGFGGDAKSAFFYAQAANEVAVIAFTDWDAGMPAEERSEAA